MKRFNKSSRLDQKYSDFKEEDLLSAIPLESPQSLHESHKYRIAQLLHSLNNLTDLMLSIDKDGVIKWANDKLFSEKFGYSILLNGKSLSSIVEEFKYRENFEEILKVVVRDGMWQGKVTFVFPNLEMSSQWLKLLTTFDSDCNREIIALFSEIQENTPNLKTNFESVDLFTGMYTYDQLVYDLQQMIRKHSTSKHTLFFILGIRNVNDILIMRGRDHLERILRKFVQIVSPNFDIYKMDNYDIGLLINTSTNPNEYFAHIEHFIRMYDYSFNVDGYDYHVKLHAGMNTVSSRFQSVDEFIQETRLAKEIAEVGNHHLMSKDHLDAKSYVEDLEVSDRFFKALNNQELYMVYQPILDLQGKISGVEALVRWYDPVFGNVPADKIIQYSENNGTMMQLGYWIIQRVFSDCRLLLNNESFNGYISINLSVEQFKESSFTETVLSLTQQSNINPNRIMFEITETKAFENMDLIIEGTKSLSENGFTIALDDFGVGYSTMTNLVDLPLDAIKIDKSLINKAIEDPRRVMICNAIVSLSRNLKLSIIAEGIENISDELLVKQLEVDYVQGYKYYKPMTIDKIINMLDVTLEHN